MEKSYNPLPPPPPPPHTHTHTGSSVSPKSNTPGFQSVISFSRTQIFCTCASEGTRVARARGLSDRCQGGRRRPVGGVCRQCREPALLARAAHGHTTGTLYYATPSNPAFCYRYYSATLPAVTLTYPTPLHQEPQQRGSSAAKKKGRKKKRKKKKKKYQLDKVTGIPRLVTEQVTKSGTQGLYTPVWTFSTASCARMARAL